MGDHKHFFKLVKADGVYPWEEYLWRCECGQWCSRWKRMYWNGGVWPSHN